MANIPVIKGKGFEAESVIEAAKLMVNSARTAPKSAGIDDIEIALVYGAEKDALVEKMLEIAEEKNDIFFKRDAESVKKSQAVLLIGVNGGNPLWINCGACGFETCKEFKNAERKDHEHFKGPNCTFKILDLGIAIGSAVRTASLLNVDNRIMFRAGTAARKLKYLESDVVMAIPLASLGKNPFFDRKAPIFKPTKQ